MALLWNADLSTGNASQYGGWAYGGTFDGTPPLSERMTVATTIDGFTPAQGSYLMRIRVAPGDVYGPAGAEGASGWSTGTRMPPEYTNGGSIVMRTPGYDSSYTWCVLVPSNWPEDANIWNSGPEWHHTGTNVAPHHFIIYSGSMYVDVRGGGQNSQILYVNNTFLSGYQKGVWYVFTERYKHNPNPNGAYELWYGKLGTHSTMQQLISAPNIGTMYSDVLQQYMVYSVYRSRSGTQMIEYYHGGWREYSTVAEAKLWGEQILQGVGPPAPPGPNLTPDANTRTRRFGKTTVGGGRTGLNADVKRGSKFATGLAVGEEADVKDMHVFVEGLDGSASTQKVTLGIYADDGASGAPGTKFGEMPEFTAAGNAAGDWYKVTHATAIRVTGANAWLISTAGTPAFRCSFAHDTVTAGLVFNSDTYEASAPRMATPFGTPSTENKEMSVIADYDVVGGTSPPPGDTTVPVITSSETTPGGESIQLEYDEPLNASSVPLPGDFFVLVDGNVRVVTQVTLTGSTVSLALAFTIVTGQTVTVSYTRVSGREIEDIAGNLAANLSSRAVVNNVDEASVSGRITTIARSTSITRGSGTRVQDAGGGGI